MEKTYVFNQDGAGGTSNGLLASILPSLQNRGIDTGYLMGLMNGGGGNGGFFGNNGGFQDIIVLIVIAAIFGNGNFGFGGNNNQGANEGRDMIMQMLNRNGVDIASLAQALNLSSDQILAGINSVSQAICGLGNQMGQNTNSIITAIMQGNQSISAQLADCCCKTQTAIERQGYESRLASCENMNTLTRTMEGNTRSLSDAYREGFHFVPVPNCSGRKPFILSQYLNCFRFIILFFSYYYRYGADDCTTFLKFASAYFKGLSSNFI